MADIKQALETASGLLSCFCNIFVGFELVYLFVCAPDLMFVTTRRSLGDFSGMLSVVRWSELGGAHPLHGSGTGCGMGQPQPCVHVCMSGQITWKCTGSNAFHAQGTTKHFT